MCQYYTKFSFICLTSSFMIIKNDYTIVHQFMLIEFKINLKLSIISFVASSNGIKRSIMSSLVSRELPKILMTCMMQRPSLRSCSIIPMRQYVIIATYIWIRTAFSLILKKDLTLRCCLIHLRTARLAIYVWILTPDFVLLNFANPKSYIQRSIVVESTA